MLTTGWGQFVTLRSVPHGTVLSHLYSWQSLSFDSSGSSQGNFLPIIENSSTSNVLLILEYGREL